MTPYLIFETANFHGGDPEKLTELIAHLASLDISMQRGIKFHPIAADSLARPSYTHYPLYQMFEISPDVWREIIARASQHFDVWLEMADSNCFAILANNKGSITGVKLQASMLENAEVIGLLQSIDLSELQIIANISGFEIDEIRKIINRLIRAGFLESNIFLQIGFQKYPATVEDSQFNKISILKAAFPDFRLGIADHISAGDPYAEILPAIAYALGCVLIEKHVCLAREETKFDAVSALELEEITTMQRHIESVVYSFSSKFISAAETTYLQESRLLPCSAHSKREGSLVGSRDLIYRRQGGSPLTMEQIQYLQSGFAVLAASHEAGDAFLETSFRKAHIAAVIACRMKSERLQNKALLPLGGKAVIECCIENCQRMQHLDSVFLATSTIEEDAILEQAAIKAGCGFYRGDPDDVMARYVDLARDRKIDVIVRVTGDNPVVSPEIADYLLGEHFRVGADFTRATNDAVGTGVHIINVEAMRRVIEILGEAPMSEYMNWYFENNPEVFSIHLVELPPSLSRDYRLTIDYIEDYSLLCNIFDTLRLDNLPYTLANVFAVLDQSPKWSQLNSKMIVKYYADGKLIEDLKVKTRLPVAMRQFNPDLSKDA